jgi:hypothetical protein
MISFKYLFVVSEIDFRSDQNHRNVRTTLPDFRNPFIENIREGFRMNNGKTNEKDARLFVGLTSQLVVPLLTWNNWRNILDNLGMWKHSFIRIEFKLSFKGKMVGLKSPCRPEVALGRIPLDLKHVTCTSLDNWFGNNCIGDLLDLFMT